MAVGSPVTGCKLVISTSWHTSASKLAVKSCISLMEIHLWGKRMNVPLRT